MSNQHSTGSSSLEPLAKENLLIFHFKWATVVAISDFYIFSNLKYNKPML